jgi:hypothetical protein
MITIEYFEDRASVYGICRCPEAALPIVLQFDPNFMESVIQHGEGEKLFTNDTDLPKLEAGILAEKLEFAGFPVEFKAIPRN